MSLEKCPICRGHTVFCGEEGSSECCGCHMILCTECNTLFDLSDSVDDSSCDELSSLKSEIEKHWNKLLKDKGENDESK